MNRRIFLPLILIVVLILSACGSSEADEIAKIHGAMDAYSDALLAGDLDQWLSIWDEDGVRMPGNEPRTVGLEQIRASIEPALELVEFEEFEIYPEEIHVMEDKAYTHGLYNYTMTFKDSGDSMEFSGKFLTIYQKQEDGSWKIAVDSFSGNAPPAAPPAPSVDEEIAKIQEASKEYASALVDGDLERWISVWAEDGVQMPPEAPRVIGADQIKAGTGPLLEMLDFKEFTTYDEVIHILGDHAYAHGLYNYTMSPIDSEETIKFDGKYLTIWEKQADGSWKAAVDIFNSNAPPPAPAEDEAEAMGEKEADGYWCYVPVFDRLEPVTFDPYEGDPGKEFFKVPYQSEWTGLISGESKGYGMLIGRVIDPEMPSEPFLFVDTESFTDAEIDSKVGGLHMDFFGNRDALGSDWKGTWIITGGTDELEGVSGEGTFWGPGWMPDADSEECGNMGLIYYEGVIEFGSE
ncbi:MAG: DUF4440 domain-containing protein [Anaerolineales bacterium]